MQCLHEIVLQGGVDGLRVVLGLELGLIDTNKLLPFPRFFAETVIGDAIQPGGKFRLAAKAPEVFVGAQKSLLSKIIGQGQVASRELAQKAADGGLMIAHKLSERVVIIFEKNPCNEISVIERHSRSLHLGGSFFLMNVEAPDQQIPKSNDEWDET